jgi:hypothetical protein
MNQARESVERARVIPALVMLSVVESDRRRLRGSAESLDNNSRRRLKDRKKGLEGKRIRTIETGPMHQAI